MKKNTILLILLLGISFFGYSSTVLATPISGLVGEWLFNGNANDTSGYSNNGIVSGATLTNDRFGNANGAYSFDGNDTIKVLHDSVLNPGTGSYSISYWMNNQQISDVYSRLIYKHGTGAGDRGYYSAIRNNGSFGMGYGSSYPNNSGETPAPNNLAHNEWHFITAILDRDIDGLTEDVVLYIGDEEVARVTTTVIENMNNTYDLYFGSHAGWTEFFVGQLDDIRMYDYALNQSEISELYREGTAMVSAPSGLFLFGIGMLGFYRIGRKKL